MDNNGISGALSFMAFLVFLMLAFWCVNIFRHIRAGGWKGFTAAVDISGALLLAGALTAIVLPLLR